jgi:hypothetical protein
METFEARVEDWEVRLRDVLAKGQSMVAEQKRAREDVDSAVKAEVKEDTTADRYAGFPRAPSIVQQVRYLAVMRELEIIFGHASIATD